jgi:muramoyltetrapeptide carboxypeptidase
VGVAALSGPVDPERLERGLAALEALGFTPVPADNLASRHGLFAGDDAARLAAFHRLAADPSLAAIFFTRGGHGLLRVLPGIDWELLRRRPRAWVGYSDLTPFLLAVERRLGLVAFHGPLVAAELARGLAPEEEASLLGALAGRYPAEVPLGGWVRRPAEGADGLEGGPSGPLRGGCLSLLAATLGTPWAADLGGSLLFFEDVQEPPYRVDRMLTHLGLSGTLSAIQGMIVGHLDSGPPPDPVQAPDWPAVVSDAVARFEWPVAWGLPSGHRAPNWTLPLGLPARLAGDPPRLVLGEGP